MNITNGNFTFTCPHCGQHLEAEPDMAGMKMKCPTCALPITVPQPFSFTCPYCGQHLNATPDMTDTLLDCPKCGMSVSVPAPTDQKDASTMEPADASSEEESEKGFIPPSAKPKVDKTHDNSKASIPKPEVDVAKNEDVAATFKFSRLIPLAICCLGFGWIASREPFALENVIYASSRWQILPIAALALFASFCGIRHFLRLKKVPWDILVAVCIFTAFFGMKMLFWLQYAAAYAANHPNVNAKGEVGFLYSILRTIGESYSAVINNQAERLDWIVSVGFCEEAVKLLPLLLLLAFRNKLSFKLDLSFRTFLLLGFFSGLGFGIAEALDSQGGYSLKPLADLFTELTNFMRVASNLPQPGPEPTPPSIENFQRMVTVGQGWTAYRDVVTDIDAYNFAVARYRSALENWNAIVANYSAAVREYADLIKEAQKAIRSNGLHNQLLRWFACVPSHAIYTVVDAACLWMLWEFISRSRHIIGMFLWYAGCVAVIATLHGIYDYYCDTTDYGIVFAAASLVMMWIIVRLASRVKAVAEDESLNGFEDMESQSALTWKSFFAIYLAIAIAIAVYVATMCKPLEELSDFLK